MNVFKQTVLMKISLAWGGLKGIHSGGAQSILGFGKNVEDLKRDKYRDLVF